MALAIDVAYHLAQLAANDEEPDYLTHLRLQKLLYYVQAWSLVERGEVLFSEPIEARAHGPVVPAVYSRFCEHGRRTILPEDFDESGTDLSDDERDFVASVWEAYKGFSALKLREMTHQEDPWVNARGGHGPADRCHNEIAPEAIREYFAATPAD